MSITRHAETINHKMATNLRFDPDQHTEDTLKAFNDFILTYTLRYDAQYPDPPKVSMDTAIARWKNAHPEQNPTLEQYDDLRDDWRSKDMVTKFLGLFSSPRMYDDWCVVEPDEMARKKATWNIFVSTNLPKT